MGFRLMANILANAAEKRRMGVGGQAQHIEVLQLNCYNQNKKG